MNNINSYILCHNIEWLVVNKPAGMSVHNDRLCLIDQINTYFDEIYAPVHRLDKETSGIIILAKKNAVYKIQNSLKTAQKIYWGLVRGHVSQDDGIWNEKITNKAEGHKNPLGKSSDRVEAKTHFKVIKKNKFISLLELTLESGRQHQIRKHASINKHEILFDKRYGDRKYHKTLKRIFNNDRMCLHARELKINIDGKKYHFKAEENEFLENYGL